MVEPAPARRRAGRTERVLVRRIGPGEPAGRVPDELIVEEPLSIRLDGTLVSTTMRTPGHDFELAVGFCHAEGLLDGIPVRGVRYCATGSAVDTEFNVVTVETGGLAPQPRPRLGTVGSSCGICGSVAIDELCARLEPVHAPRFPLETLAAAPDVVRDAQALFSLTGGVHAAAALSADGGLVLVREDIGRHNAVDKVIGWAAREGRLPLRGHALLVSSRAGFEIAQKAAVAGVPVLACVSAATTLAVEVADRAGLTLLGFVREPRATVYTHTHRIPESEPGL